MAQDRLLTMTENDMHKSRIVLTDAEKDIKSFLSLVKNPNFKITEAFLENFAIRYAETVMRGTRFQDMNINFKEIANNPAALGSMSVNEAQKSINLKMNLSLFVNQLGFDSQDPEERLVAAYQFVKTLNHELTHTMQDLEAGKKFIPSVNGGYTILEKLKFAREDKAQESDEEYFYDENYSDTNVEGDANKKSVIKTGIQFFRIFPKDTMPKSLQKTIVDDVIDSPKNHEVDYNTMSYDKGKQESREEVTRKYADELMAGSVNPGEPVILNSKIVEKPILAFEYEEDGSPKSYVRLLNDRDACFKATFENQKIREDTRLELLTQYTEVYSQLLINSLRRAEPEEIIEIRKLMGDDKFLESLNFSLMGKTLEATRFVDKHTEYLDVFEYLCTNDRLDSFRKIKHAIEELDEKAGIDSRFEKRIDPKTNEERIEITAYRLCSPETAFIGKLADQVADTKDQYKDEMYEETRVGRIEFVEKMDEYAMDRKVDLQLDHIEREERKKRGDKIEVTDEVLEEEKAKYSLPIPTKSFVRETLSGYLYTTCIEGKSYDLASDMIKAKEAQKAKEGQKIDDEQIAEGKIVDASFEEIEETTVTDANDTSVVTSSNINTSSSKVVQSAKPKRTITGFIKGIFGLNKAKANGKTTGSKYSQIKIGDVAQERALSEEELNKRLSSHRVYSGALKERIEKQKEMCLELNEIEPSLTMSENQKIIEEQIGIIESFEKMQQGVQEKGEELAHVK